MEIKPVKDSELFRCTIFKHINNIIKNKSISKNIEISIFNYSIQKSKEEKIIKKWNNELFVIIYLNKFKIIFNNIKNPMILNKIKKKK